MKADNVQLFYLGCKMPNEKEVPKECPVGDTCDRDIGLHVHNFHCSTDAWLSCPWVPEEEKKDYKMKPREWKVLKTKAIP